MTRSPCRLAAALTCGIVALAPWPLLAQALRIVTLSPHAAELVAAAGAADRLVGVVAFTDQPPEVAGLPVIGDARGLDRERIIALQPDLVVAWPDGNRPTDLNWLAGRGIGIFESAPASLDDIPREIRALARLTGTKDAGDDAARRLDTAIERLRKAHADETPLSWFYQLWSRPPMTFGGRALLTGALGECGAINVFAGVPRDSFTPDPESLLRAAPHVEIIPAENGEAAALTTAPRTLRVEADSLYRPGPRLVAAVSALCGALRWKGE